MINKRNNNEFDQVWIITCEAVGKMNFVVNESCMFGRNAYWINGYQQNAKSYQCDFFPIIYANYERADTFLHSMGHMSECILANLYHNDTVINNSDVTIDYNPNNWYVENETEYNNLSTIEKFIYCKYKASDNSFSKYGVGAVHFGPNTLEQYQIYSLHDKVWSNWKDWRDNYPNLKGEWELTDESAWLSQPAPSGNQDAERLHMRWWFSIIPHVSGRDEKGYYHNWWKYITTLDFVESISSDYSYISVVDDNQKLSYKLNYKSGKTELLSNNEGVVVKDDSILNVLSDGTIERKKRGTTEIEVWRDGSKYTFYATVESCEINLDPNGGEVYPSRLVLNYGDTIGTLPTPIMSGYRFDGWYTKVDGGDPISESTIVKESTTYYAHWTRVSYNITYDLDGGVNSDENPSTYTIDDEITLINPTKTDYVFLGWTGSNGETPEKNIKIEKGTTGDLSYVANWKIIELNYKVNHYTQNIDGTYNDEPDDIYEDIVVIHTKVIPEVKSYTGFTSPTEKEVAIETEGQEINYYYTRNSYTLTIVKGEGIASVSAKSKYLYEEEIVPNVTYKAGYHKAVWSIDNFVGSMMPANDLTVSVQASPIQYSITYYLNGGTDNGANPTTYIVKSPDIYLEAPTKEGYQFDGWETNNPGGAIIYSGTTGNLTFTAKWHQAGGIIMPSKCDYTVEHYKQTIAGTYPLVPTETESFIAVEGSEVEPMVKSYEGYKSPDIQKVQITVENQVIKYYYQRQSYTVTINKGDGIKTVTGEGTYVYQDKVKLSAETEKEDAVVIWTCGGVIQDTVFNMPAYDMVINCSTTNELNRYYITYDLDGGYAEGNPDSFTIEDEFTLNNPIRNGYTFIGWGTDDGEVKMIVTVPKGTNKDLHFKANWKRIEETENTIKYTVEEYLERQDGTFNTIPDYTSSYVGEKGSVVKVSTSEFEGFISPECEVIVLNTEKKVRYYYSRNTYKLTIEQGPGIERIYGTNLDKNTFKFGEEFEIKADIKDGYQNLTWTENGTRIESPYNRMPAHDVYIKCSAQAITYKITYDLKGGQISNNPTSYTVEDEIVLPQPILYGYTFKGWIGSNGSNPDMNVTIPKGSSGDKEYTAVWEKMTQGAQMDLTIGFSTIKPTNQDVTAYIISNTKLKETDTWKYVDDEYKLYKVFGENTEEMVYVEPLEGEGNLPVKIIVSNIDKTPPNVEVSSYYVDDNKSKVITLTSDKYVEAIDGWYTDDNLTFVKTFTANASETVNLKDEAGNEVSKTIVVNDLKAGVTNVSMLSASMDNQVGKVTNTTTNTTNTVSRSTRNAYVNNTESDNTVDGNMPKTGSSSTALIVVGIPLLVVAIILFRKYRLNSYKY